MKSSILIHNYTIPLMGVKKKIVYHFSDVHLTEFDSLSDESERQRAVEGTREWEGLRAEFAEDHGEACDEGQLISTGEHFKNLLEASADGDAVIMAGDILDYVSGANLRFLDSALSGVTVPYMMVCGNHEKAEEIPDGKLYSGLKDPVQIIDLGDMVIFGTDNSKRQITAQQNNALAKALSVGKPVLIVMHVPVCTEGNRGLFDEYFQLDHRGASAEVHEFIGMIKENADKIVAVLAGHLHFANNSEIAPGVTQYVSTQGALGNVNRYVIGE